MNRIFIRSGAFAALLLGCVGIAACSDDTTPANNTTTSTNDAGTASTTTTLSLYDRLGGKSGLEAFVKKVVDEKVLTDADLKTYFFNQVATPIPAGHPSAAQITVCFARFIGSALNADTYPGEPVNDATNTNTPNHTCRDMVSAHNKAGTMLNIGSGTFDKFVGAIAASLQPLVKPTATNAGEITQAEFDALAAALNGQKGGVTTPGAPAGPAPFQAP